MPRKVVLSLYQIQLKIKTFYKNHPPLPLPPLPQGGFIPINVNPIGGGGAGVAAPSIEEDIKAIFPNERFRNENDTYIRHCIHVWMHKEEIAKSYYPLILNGQIKASEILSTIPFMSEYETLFQNAENVRRSFSDPFKILQA